MAAKKDLFTLHLPFTPSGDQPDAITKLIEQRPGWSTLLGVTGSGKTFTLANMIAKQAKPVVILSPNKTLAAQLYEEFSLFFPENKVCYFVSYYDYYQPESYLPAQDIYIPKETKINTEIERLRVEATASIINRPDTIIIASVSAIYSLGNPSDYRSLTFSIAVGDRITRKDLINKLIFIQYKRNDLQRVSGTFSVLGNTILLCLPYLHNNLRIELFGDVIERIELVDKYNSTVTSEVDTMIIFPAKHFVSTTDQRDRAVAQIRNDLSVALRLIENPLYKERLKTRVNNDIDMLLETGYCSGIENYSRYFDGRLPGDRPYCLFDFFDDDFLLIIDESHIAVPQLSGMYKGDRSRKKSLVDFGFRLPSAFDNRPLKFEEIETLFKDVVFVSATPGEYERKNCVNIVEQIVRPTGIIDPPIEIVQRNGQIDHLVEQIEKTVKQGFRTLVTVLTKRMAEDLAQYLENKKVKVCYLHSDIKTPQRSELLQKLRLGVFDVLVGINLLREGLDLPEVALVAIMDADIEGFLRDRRSLIQTIGRAARNTQSRVIFYADRMTKSIQAALDETERRRGLQEAYNLEHGITPRSVQREVKKTISSFQKQIMEGSKRYRPERKNVPSSATERKALIENLQQEMDGAAEALDFEKAITLRNRILELRRSR